MKHLEKVKQRVASAKHLSKNKPSMVTYDKRGRWLFEVYSPKDTKFITYK